MPPVRKTIRVKQLYNGDEALDLRSQGVNLLYIPNFLEEADSMFLRLKHSNAFDQHSYLNRFKRQITPHRLTHAHVPDGRRYRFMGKDLTRKVDDDFYTQYTSLLDKLSGLDDIITKLPNASVSNAYRYNSDDYIAPHTDDEKFLEKSNTTLWKDSTVFTLTLLADPSKPMKYRFANPNQDGTCVDGYEITPKHGSLIMQGSVLHTVVPISGDGGIGRISVTLRTLQDCDHPKPCVKITCPRNAGPSNYLFYSNKSAISTSTTTTATATATAKPIVKIKAKIKRDIIKD